ncbi:MAG TPA: S1/P1 nuclease [Pyrinomonadaceae bacterium]|nr:S1/P1 nuclease [Pyrinomonadaceae bacterium]
MQIKLRALLLAAALCVPQVAAFAWGDTGHMVVGHIAHSRLDKDAAERVAELSPLMNFQKMAGKPAKMTLFTYQPASLAVWMDDMKDVTDRYDEWHYINKPLPAMAVNMPSVHVERKLGELISELRAGVRNKTLTRKREATLVAFLFHLVGDVHQPMHAASRWRDKNRHDLGGNSFPLTHPRRNNLHSFWDAAGGYFNYRDPDHRTKGKLTAAEEKSIRDHAFDIMSANPPGKTPGWQNLDVSAWVAESYDYAGRYAYGDISRNGQPAQLLVTGLGGNQQTYEQRAREVSAQRMALAGYRLAELLNDIYRQQ